ncbi:MAG: hypothetical protein PHX07_02100 [Candidatus Marinimicrobia bacterium]|nr:hypothetical protein [Candidatus Neomarinimicrobiota bacterium]
MSENRKSNLENLRKLAKLSGVDIDEAFEEIKTEIVERIKPLLNQSPAPAVDVKELASEVLPALTEQIHTHINKSVADTETRIGLKLAEALEAIQKQLTTITASKAGVDSNTIIQGVVQVLQPEIVKASQEAADAVFQVNAKSMMEAINAQLSARMEQAQSPRSPAGGLLGGILNNPEIMSKLLDKVLGAPAAPQNAFMADFSRMMGFHDLMTKIEKRVATSEDIAKGFQNITSPNPQIPGIQQTEAPKA